MLRLAWRNLWRTRTRTSIVILVIALSYALMLVSLGMGDAAHSKMEEAAVRSAGGSILVHGLGYWDSQSSSDLIDDPATVLAAARALPGVTAAIPRVIVNGLISSSRGSSGVHLSGIAPADEARLLNLQTHLAAGAFLDGQTSDPLVLGSGIVDDLELQLGDRVVLTATDPNGDVVRSLFHLSGILETGNKSFDESMGYTTIAAAQHALGLGDRLTQVGLLLDNDKDRHAVRDALVARLGDHAHGLELLTWDEAIPEMVGAIQIDDAFGYIYAIILFAVVGFGIANTFLMSVMERIREFGLLGALGLTPGRTVRLVLAEAVLLGVVSLVVGFGIGFALHYYLHQHGIDLTDFYGGNVEISGVIMDDLFIRSELRPLKWLFFSGGVFTLVLFTAAYPALRAMRLDPAKAMRTFQ